MNITKSIAATVAAGALLVSATACTDTVRGSAEPAVDVPTAQPAPAPTPPVDVAELAEQSFVDTIEQEGIAYPSRDDLLNAAHQACAASGNGLLAMADVFIADGYGQDDAYYMAGAAIVVCGLVDGGEPA